MIESTTQNDCVPFCMKQGKGKGKREMNSAWGDKETQYFFSLTPEKILSSVESSGVRCSGRCLPLNSLENRVYEVELELDRSTLTNPSEGFVIAKFYRPGRWSEKQILEEHEFLHDLQEAEIPVAAPLKFADGRTLHEVKELGIWYALFPKIGGRRVDELSLEEYEQVGRLLGRMHVVGKQKQASQRVQINAHSYGQVNLDFLLENKWIPFELEKAYREVVQNILGVAEEKLDLTSSQRVHGDAHFGNLLYTREKGYFWVDFDDMLRGPVVQDLWLIVRGDDDYAKREQNALLTGYEQMATFPNQQLKWIEILRALRFIHFHGWIGKRWEDPSFVNAFPKYQSSDYWATEIHDLEKQWEKIAKTTTSYSL